ncbi:MAG: hypothetical protein AB1384_09355 [Actinomycetota bacterium]
MKRWPILVVSLTAVAVLALLAAGCGGSDNAATGGDSGTGQGGPVGQAESAACAANRKMISSALQQYENLEGSPARSIQALVPGYLQSVPSCPSGGTYTLQGNKVSCSVHGS